MSIMKRDAYLISHKKKLALTHLTSPKKQLREQLLFFCTLACVLEGV